MRSRIACCSSVSSRTPRQATSFPEQAGYARSDGKARDGGNAEAFVSSTTGL
jgi:hypothetical protein